MGMWRERNCIADWAMLGLIIVYIESPLPARNCVENGEGVGYLNSNNT